MLGSLGRWGALGALLALHAPADAALPRPLFYLPLDEGLTAALAGGSATPNSAAEDPLLAMAALPRFVAGQVGRGFDLDDTPLHYRAAGNFNPAEGTVALWVSPHFEGQNKETYAAFFGAGDWGMVYKYLNQTTLTFATGKPDKDLYYDCGGGDVSAWRPGEWHHLAICWSRAGNYRLLFLDGRQIGRGPFPSHREPVDLLYVGGACRPYQRESAHSALDELAIWDRALDEAQVNEVYALGRAGRPLAAVSAIERDRGAQLDLVDPRLPAAPEPEAAGVTREGDRERLSLDGWWAYLPALDPLLELPAEGWGLARLPGYRNAAGATLTPNGQATTGAWPWAGGNVNEAPVSYYQRRFAAPDAWRGRPVFLHLGGVDGLAEIYLNGERLGRLPGFEDEAFEVSTRLRADNVLTIALHRRSGTSLPGFYDSIVLRAYPPLFVKDVVVRSDVPGQKITFSCDVWAAEAAAGSLEFAVAEDSAPAAEVKHFRQPCALRAADRAAPELSAQVQRLEATFPWPEGRPWTYDQPFLYQVTARLSAAGASDTAPPTRFGHRTFEQRDGGFYLNGQPTHLRGHQIDLGWGNQFPRLEELKAAGLNAFEFSAPVSATWYRALPYRLGEYERFLSYADEHGLIAIPLLPDAQVLRERLFDPEVARLYRRRLDKHVRRFGNHASVGLWFMHFNLAGYRWYVAPSLNDGSHQPSDPLWRQKERYALQAERLYQEVDRRPLYHHACGNLGDSFTANIYIGPTSPLQEREEWPRRWAESRRKPLLAVEHGLMLIPYWFRYRDFPLDKVYASEPLFDEISAMYLGRSAYRQLTPELFELYDVGRAPRPTRMRTLIQRHPGYQQVKSYFASRSLRSWRTYGISATIFNAENWDFKDATGQPLPVMQAMARYFGDTDLYVAGWGDDWPSKDHAWFAGEPLRKQVVLLNDLGRDLPVTLTWSLAPSGGQAAQQGTCQAVARAGEVTMVPLQLTAPTVTARTDFTLTITPPEGGPFQPESFALSVWPKPARPAVEGGVLVHDVEGRATAMLAAAGLAARPLRQAANLQGVKLVVVGRRSLDDEFLAQARRLNLEAAVRDGANLLILEQTSGRPLGLELKEQSTRQAFIAAPGHPYLAGLTAADLVDLRGQSDLLEPYPAAPPETEKQFPARFFKWGNRGVLASYVYTKPHLAGYRPILECGFDLADSPLLEGRFGRGRVTLCQVDLTHRYGLDPVATALADNLLAALSQPGPAAHAVAVSEAASTFLAPYGLAPAASSEAAGLVISERWSPALEAQARAGATVLLLPGAKAPELGLSTTPQRVFIAHPEEHPLLAGLSGADLYFKEWTELPVIAPVNGWQPLAAPAVLAVKSLDQGQVIACTVDPFLLGNRGQVKATRFWSLLLANLGAAREPTGWLAPTRPLYVPNPLEVIPPYMNW